MNYLELNARLETKELAPLYLFYGEEGFLIEEYIKKIIDIAVSPDYREANYVSLDARETNISDLLFWAKTFPFLAEKRLAIVRNANELKGNEKNLEAYCHDPFSETIIIFVINQKEPHRGKVFFQIIATKGWAVPFPRLREKEAAAWIGKKFAAMQYSINSQARELLLEKVGTSLQSLAQEIEKIITFAGEKNVIELSDVEAVVGRSRLENLFNLADSIGQKKMEKALGILDRLLISGETHLGILGMIQRQFRLIWQVKELAENGLNSGAIAKKMGQPPWLVQKLLNQSQGFDLEQLQSFFINFLQADLELKNSDHAPRHTLEFLIFRLCTDLS